MRRFGSCGVDAKQTIQTLLFVFLRCGFMEQIYCSRF